MLKKLFGAVSVLAMIATFSVFSQAAYPDKPIKVIVPTAAGGAVDTIARIFQRVFTQENIITQKMAIINLPGAGGTIGTRRLKDATPDGYTIGFWHDGITTSKAMGVVDYDYTAFEVIGISGYTEVGLGVRNDSPYKTFGDAVAKLKAEPKSVKVAVNIGLPVHFNPLIAFSLAHVDPLMVQVGGGAKRLASILGGHTDTAVFAIPEFIKYKESGLVPMVLFSAKRNELLPDVQTAKEAGIDFVTQSNRIWLAPKGTPKEVVEFLADAFARAIALPAVSKELADLGITPKFIGPKESVEILKAYLEQVLPVVPLARTVQQ